LGIDSGDIPTIPLMEVTKSGCLAPKWAGGRVRKGVGRRTVRD